MSNKLALRPTYWASVTGAENSLITSLMNVVLWRISFTMF